MRSDEDIRKSIDVQARRMKKAERERATLMSQTIYIGMLGLLFVLPVIAGAYIGVWLDDMARNFSTRWTVSLILVGVAVGFVNVYLYIRGE